VPARALVVLLSFNLDTAILDESGLSFLGLGEAVVRNDAGKRQELHGR
jgi:ABC-type dipeptide/oligopeptide/nickel transport system permease subunit